MAEIIRYVDTGVSGGLGDGTSWVNAYTSLFIWNVSEATDLVSAGNTHKVFCRASTSLADSTIFTIDAWVTDASNFITIEATEGDEALKTGYDNTRYRLEFTNSNQIVIDQDYTVMKGIQLLALSRRTLRITGNQCLIDSCFIASNNTYASGGVLDVVGLGTSNKAQNCIITYITTPLSKNCIFIDNGMLELYNCSITSGGAGVGIFTSSDGSTVTKNCAIFNNTTDVQTTSGGVVTFDYNATDSGIGTNPIAPLGSDWGNEFEDYTNNNFTLLNSGNLYQGGTGPTIDSEVPLEDIDGDTRSGAVCDIGADEYIISGIIINLIGIVDGTADVESILNRLINIISQSDGIADVEALLNKIFNLVAQIEGEASVESTISFVQSILEILYVEAKRVTTLRYSGVYKKK